MTKYSLLNFIWCVPRLSKCINYVINNKISIYLHVHKVGEWVDIHVHDGGNAGNLGHALHHLVGSLEQLTEDGGGVLGLLAPEEAHGAHVDVGTTLNWDDKGSDNWCVLLFLLQLNVKINLSRK